jgi:asparagine synthase (glutamine-hydrolysing)
MCGFVCHLSFSSEDQISVPLLNAMANEIHHRGPDADGYFNNEWVGMGFKRLSILDLSSNGHQPMKDVSGSFVIMMNGEIYNYKVLKHDLIQLGYSFKSDTDTEVVLNGYKQWGTNVFNKLQGMFSIVIYDKTIDEVIIARDHLGIKPLYFFHNNDFIVLASEVKSLRHKISFELNQKKIYEQFVYGYVAGEDTIYKDIHRLLPGTFKKFNKQGLVSTTTYYNVTDGIYTKGYQNISDENIKLKLKESILQHTVSDVGYNVQLSGGVDSSYITAVLSKNYNQKLHTYSIRLDGFEGDESKYQKIVAEKYNTTHHGFNFGAKELFDNYEKATWHHDLPMVHPASVLLMLLCEESRNNSKVILTGEGADELFGGYSRYDIKKKYLLYDVLSKKPLIQNLMPKTPKFNRLKKYLKAHEFGIDEAVYFSIEKELKLFEGLKKDIKYRKNVANKYSKLIHKMMASDQTTYLNWLFERQDKMSMAMSVESRVPFSNHLLFDEMNSVNPIKKIKPHTKSILKRLALDYFDESFIYRRKNGFVLPYGSWLRNEKELKSWFDLLLDSKFKNRGFYNASEISKMIDEHLYKGIDNSKYLMNIINFEIWHRQFIDN